MVIFILTRFMLVTIVLHQQTLILLTLLWPEFLDKLQIVQVTSVPVSFGPTFFWRILTIFFYFIPFLLCFDQKCFTEMIIFDLISIKFWRQEEKFSTGTFFCPNFFWLLLLHLTFWHERAAFQSVGVRVFDWQRRQWPL